MVEQTNAGEHTTSQESRVQLGAEAGARGLNESEFKVYDRQLRLWGFEAQQKMKNSLVLLVNLTPTCTELARHLVLSGINVWIVGAQDAQPVSEDDTESDFLFSPADVGKVRGEVIKTKLSEMNPFVQIEFLADSSSPQTIEALAERAKALNRHVSVIVEGFSTWASAAKLNAEVRAIGAVFYSVSSAGLYGFAFADLGPSLSYQYTVKDVKTSDASMQAATVADSLTLEASLASFQDPATKLGWNRRRKQPSKMLMAALLTMLCKEQDSPQPMSQVVQLLKQKGHSGFEATSEQKGQFESLCGEVARMWGLHFNPCSSVIGSVLSQEVIKVITQRDHPGHGFFLYDSQHQCLTIERPL